MMIVNRFEIGEKADSIYYTTCVSDFLEMQGRN